MDTPYLARDLGARRRCSQNEGVDKTIYTLQADCIRKTLVELRKKAGMSQRQLAEKLKRERNFVGRLEVGERRLDMIEMYWICRACNADPKKLLTDIIRKFDRIEMTGKE